MALMEGQVRIGDLFLGPGTAYPLTEEFNPWGLQVRSDQSGERAWNHGSWSGAEWVEERTVPLRIAVLGDDPATVLDAQLAVSAALAPAGDQNTEMEVTFRRGGRDYAVYGRPRMVETAVEGLAGGITYLNTAVVALDPRIYSANVVQDTIGLPSFTGGLTAPLSAPITVDAQLVGGRAILTNAGTANVPLQLRITGPLTDPWIAVQHPIGGVAVLRFGITLAANQWLDVDTGARTVVFNDTQSRRGRTSGDWPLLPPGQHELRFFAGDGAGTLTVTHRSAWW